MVRHDGISVARIWQQAERVVQIRYRRAVGRLHQYPRPRLFLVFSPHRMLDELDCDALRLHLICGEWGLDATADGLGGVGRYAGSTARTEQAESEEKEGCPDTVA